MALKYTPVDDIPKTVEQLRTVWETSRDIKNLQWRKDQLALLAYMIEENRQAFYDAFRKDLGWAPHDVDFLELNGTLTEIVEMRKNLDKYVKPKSFYGGMAFAFPKPYTKREPRGVCLIVAPYNYPIGLMLIPLAGAIAAGNVVVMKPSELTPNINALLTELVEKYLDKSHFRVINGAVEESILLFKQRFDFILYTGGGAVAKSILKAAAEYLTPVALELGGQCPAFVDDTMVDVAAKRLAWAKHQNAGQTCVSINHIFVLDKVHDRFVEKYVEAERNNWQSNTAKLVNDRHYKRVSGMLEKSQGRVVHSSGDVPDKQRLAHTVLDNVKITDPIFDDEIFGPIQPIVKVNSMQEAVKFTKTLGAPLTMYIMSSSKELVNEISTSCQSGSVVVGDALVQMTAKDFPFGGVGPSGTGVYHGRHTFDMFTYERPYVVVPAEAEAVVGFRYDPNNKWKMGILSWLLSTKINFAKPKVAGKDSKSGQPWISSLVALATTCVVSLVYLTQKGNDNFLSRYLSK